MLMIARCFFKASWSVNANAEVEVVCKLYHCIIVSRKVVMTSKIGRVS